MPSTNPLLIGLSGLQAAQRGLAVTGQNTANINTDGYSRQTIDYKASQPIFIGGSFMGSGVSGGKISRIIDAYAIADLRSATSVYNQTDNFYTKASRIDDLLADNDTGLNVGLQSFFEKAQGVTEQAGQIPPRGVLLSSANLLVERFHTLQDRLLTERDTVNKELTAAANDISVFGQKIAQLNQQIQAQSRDGLGEQPNDLLDQRDQLIQKLSELVGVQVVEQDGDVVNVFMGNGQPLVVGNNSLTLSTQTSASDPTTVDFILSSGTGSINLRQTLTGGKIGGASDYLDKIINPGLNRLGLVAIGLANEFNQQSHLGMDLNDNLGGDFFTDVNSAALTTTRAVANANNTGNAVLAITIPDSNTNGIDKLTDSDYVLKLNAGTYTLTRLSDNSVTTLPATFPGTAYDVDGFQISLSSGAMANGDSFRIQPTKDFGSKIDVVITDEKQIAAALPIKTTVPLTNTGTLSISDLVVTDTTTASFTTTPRTLSPPVTVQFTSVAGANQLNYQIVDTTTLVPGPPTVLGTGVFTLNQQNNLVAQAGLSLGYELTVQGAPNVGDAIDVSYNNGGVGENSNMKKLTSLQNAAFLDGKNSTLSQAYGVLVSDVGLRTSEAKTSRDANETLMQQAQNRRESISGVNLDEEAANLIKFQQAYSASAQVISVANQIFDTLINSVR